MCIQLQLEEYTGIKYKQFTNLSKMFDLKESCVQAEFENLNRNNTMLQLNKNHKLKHSYFGSSEYFYSPRFSPLDYSFSYLVFIFVLNFIIVLFFDDFFCPGFKTVKYVKFYWKDF
jgi:hypothetical protein